MTYVFDYIGEGLTEERITPGNTPTALTSKCYVYTEWDLKFDSGGTHELLANDWIVGATGAGRAIIVSITLSSGTWAGGDAAGTLRLKSFQGTAIVNNEVLNHDIAGTATDCATADGIAIESQADYAHKGDHAKAMLVSVVDNSAILSWTGAKPAQAATVHVGQEFTANSSIIIQDANSIRKFKCIDHTSGSASNIQVVYYF